MSSVLIDVRPGDTLALNGLVTVELVQKTGRVARLRINAPREVTIKKNPTPVVTSVPSMGNSHRN